jgi:hypothetical protein
VHYVIGQRVLTLAAADGPPGPVTSIGKLYFCPLVEDLADFRLSLDPLGGQFAPDAPSEEWVSESPGFETPGFETPGSETPGSDSPDSEAEVTAETARWLRLAYQARGTAIAGGSTYIQRGIVAERILGMPRS